MIGFFSRGGNNMAAKQHADLQQQWSQIVAQAWADEAFKRRLLADPAAVLQEHGIAVLPGVRARVVEDTDRVIHLTLPAKPSEELTDQQLQQAVGGLINFVPIPD